jgi:hypothetical protein
MVKDPVELFFGEVAEWSIASDLKSDDAARYPEVRILSSPFLLQRIQGYFS